MSDNWISPIDQRRMGGTDLMTRLANLEAQVARLYGSDLSGGMLSEIAQDSGAINIAEEVSGVPSGNIIANPSFESRPLPSSVFGTNITPFGWNRDLVGGSTAGLESTIVYHGVYSGKLTRGTLDERLYQDIYAPAGSAYVRDRVWTFGSWVYATSADKVRIFIDDGVTQTYSVYHPGNSQWLWMTVTATLGSAITTFKVGMQVVTTNGESGYMDACAVTEGSQLGAAAYPTYRVFPNEAIMWHHDSVVVSGGALVSVADTAQFFQLRSIQTPAANGDAFYHEFFLPAGTYNFDVLGLTDVNAGKIDWYLDDILYVSGQDWYSAAATRNVTKSAAVLTYLPTTGNHILTGVINGKNAASAGFTMDLTRFRLWGGQG